MISYILHKHKEHLESLQKELKEEIDSNEPNHNKIKKLKSKIYNFGLLGFQNNK